MANWKKVIVSGSAAELLNITASAANIVTLNVTAGSGSFSGSFQGDGSGLTNVPASGIVLAVLSQSLGIENFSYNGQTSAVVQLATGSNHFISGSRKTISVVDTTGASGIDLTYDQGTGVLSGSLVNSTIGLGSSTLTLGATTTTVDGLTLTNTIATGSFSGSFTGTTNLPDLTAGTGISTFTYDGGTTATVAVSGASALTTNAVTKWSGNAFVDSSLTDNGTTISGTTSIQLSGASSRLSGSFSGSFQGDGSGLTNVPASGIVLATLSNGNGIASFSYNGQSTATVAAQVSGSTLTVGASGLAVNTNGITSNELASNSVITAKILDANVTNAKLANSTISIAPGTNGSGVTDPVSLGETLTVNGTNNEINIAVGANTLTIGLPNDVTISQDLIVSRNLTVQGTASFQNTTNLDVADRFILLASGSNTTGDGGIVIQQGTNGIGEGFGYDSALTRWGVTGSFDGSQATFVPDAFMAAVVVGGAGVNDPSTAPARYVADGNMFIADNGDIFIYS